MSVSPRVGSSRTNNLRYYIVDSNRVLFYLVDMRLLDREGSYHDKENLMRYAILTLLLTSCLGLAGCSSFTGAFPSGVIYTATKAPLDFTRTTIGPKEGAASAIGILGIVATGDASIRNAAANGNIRNVTSVDYEVLNILGVYTKFTVLVTGD